MGRGPGPVKEARGILLGLIVLSSDAKVRRRKFSEEGREESLRQGSSIWEIRNQRKLVFSSLIGVLTSCLTRL